MHRHFDVAMKAAREGTLPYPDGTIIAGLAWELRPVGGKREGLWPSPIPSWPGHLRTGFFMVKDSTKYAGWGFAHFDDGKPASEAVHNTCFACHATVKERDFVFNRYAP